MSRIISISLRVHGTVEVSDDWTDEVIETEGLVRGQTFEEAVIDAFFMDPNMCDFEVDDAIGVEPTTDR